MMNFIRTFCLGWLVTRTSGLPVPGEEGRESFAQVVVDTLGVRSGPTNRGDEA
jgi:hypothetical protein